MMRGEKVRGFAIDEPQAEATGRVLGIQYDPLVDGLVAQLQMTDEQFRLFKSGQLTDFSVGGSASWVRLTWWQRLKRWVRRVAMRVLSWV